MKCDENRQGGCSNCEKHGLECDYLQLQPVVARKLLQLSGHSSVQQPEEDGDCVTFEQMAEGEPGVLLLCSTMAFDSNAFLPITNRSSLPSSLAMIHHFVLFTSHTCGSPQGQEIIQSLVMPIALQTPHLLHALLGISSTHLAHLLLPPDHEKQHRKYEMSEAWHWSQALKLFRQALAENNPSSDIAREQMDALLSTIMLVAIHQFMLKHEAAGGLSPWTENRNEFTDLSRSFVFKEDEDTRAEAMKWLTIQSGFKMLLGQLGEALQGSVWLPVLQEATLGRSSSQVPWEEPGGKIWLTDDTSEDEVEEVFCSLCNIDARSNIDNNAYYDSLSILLCLRRLQPLRKHHFNKLITFMGRITPPFKDLLLKRDPAALLILCHWLSLMLALDQWWIDHRARRECRAIVTYLLSMQRDNVLVRNLLKEPAEVVGIRL